MERLSLNDLHLLRHDPSRPPEFRSRTKDNIETFLVSPYHSLVCHTHPHRILRLYCERSRHTWLTDLRISRLFRALRVRNPNPVAKEKRMWVWSEEEEEFERMFIRLSHDQGVSAEEFPRRVAEEAREIHLRETVRMCLEGGMGVGVGGAGASASGNESGEDEEDGLDGVAMRALFEGEGSITDEEEMVEDDALDGVAMRALFGGEGLITDEWLNLYQVRAALEACEQKPEDRDISGFAPSLVEVLAEFDRWREEQEKKKSEERVEVSEDKVEVGVVPSGVRTVFEAVDQANGGIEAEVADVSWADEVD